MEAFIFVLFLLFFFQAEDGIRDRNVTGVQTCALPILAYLVFISAVSYLGSSGFGGHDILKYPYDFLVIIVASLFFYGWAVAARVDGPDQIGRASCRERV